ncbi:MAG: hypothetical protein J6T10_18895 [Methanobrevibacter sp.]|nr:hypothetical protein [Methanobrevibacter sp.]
MKTYLDNARDFLNTYKDMLDGLWGSGYRSYEAFCWRNDIEYAHGSVRFVFIGNDFVIKFNYANKATIKWAGGCADEYKCYKKFQEDGMDYLLCPVTKMKGGHHFYYVMPRVSVACDENLDEDDFTWSISEEEKEYIDRYISDIHDENFGVLNGDFVLIDYAWNIFKSR